MFDLILFESIIGDVMGCATSDMTPVYIQIERHATHNKPGPVAMELDIEEYRYIVRQEIIKGPSFTLCL
ncbi:unnamed protein product [Leptosia nina]|uniref:Uncharacterized protein n=1 Tax=Leptosia nina TaxID=320188 RepID=A0AAV1JT96_9NEOP